LKLHQTGDGRPINSTSSKPTCSLHSIANATAKFTAGKHNYETCDAGFYSPVRRIMVELSLTVT